MKLHIMFINFVTIQSNPSWVFTFQFLFCNSGLHVHFLNTPLVGVAKTPLWMPKNPLFFPALVRLGWCSHFDNHSHFSPHSGGPVPLFHFWSPFCDLNVALWKLSSTSQHIAPYIFYKWLNKLASHFKFVQYSSYLLLKQV